MAEVALRWKAEKNRGLFAIVDDADLPLVVARSWYAHRAKGSHTVYAKTSTPSGWVFMHHVIVGKRRGKEVDHRDGNGLNNRRSNLRHVTHSVNLQAAFDKRRERQFDAWFEEQMRHLSA
ncbi:HNH endonuclease [Methylobacterium sp. E-025]|uniref:HNH endonuclease n=1 Tax=Methylobacterium sp. E-025 TaxID=2836561 RepID=UPI001FBBE36B|nr:HNH endonuclease [Methylobacterium sp. E-025]MCJ2112927.1 HNH endonuclease [Methylobacterium sp. E-025]